MLPATMSPTSVLNTSVQEWEMIKEQASMLVASGILPNWIDKPEKAIAVALKGREMGVPMMQAFSHIFMVNGRCGVSSELQVAQIYKNCPGAKIEILESTDKIARVRASRPAEGEGTVFIFSIEDAQVAGLQAKSGPWRQYPKIMLLWRCLSMMARTKFPDAILGASHTPEELGAEIDAAGQVLSLPSEDKTPPVVIRDEKPAVPATLITKVEPVAAEGPKADLVTIGDIKKMFAAAAKHGVSEADIRSWLKEFKGYSSTRQMTIWDFDELMKFIESKTKQEVKI